MSTREIESLAFDFSDTLYLPWQLFAADSQPPAQVVRHVTATKHRNHVREDTAAHKSQATIAPATLTEDLRFSTQFRFLVIIVIVGLAMFVLFMAARLMH